MKALFAFLLAFAWSANAAISTATKPHTIDSAATPKVSYVDDNDEALLDKINEVIDTVNLHNSSGAVVGDLFSSTGDMRLLIDSDNNGTNRWMVTANGATDTLWRILESGSWKGFGDGYVAGKVVASDSLVGATLRATGNLSAGGTLAVTGASTIAALSATTGSFSSTLGVTGASTLAALSATTGSFSSTLGVTGASTLAALSATTGSFSSTLAASGQSTLTGVTLNGGSSGQGNIYTTATIGLGLQAKTGSSYDLSLMSVGGAGNYVLRVPTGTTTAEIPNALNLSYLSSGRIPVVSTSGLITQDNLYWDATNDRLGVGSGASSPASLVDATEDNSGTTTLRLVNSNSSATGGALLLLSANGASGGDVGINLNINGESNVVMGVDNSDSDAFVFSGGTALGTNNRIRISSTQFRAYGNLQVDGTATVTGATTLAALSATTGAFSSNLTQSAGVTTISVTDNTANAVDIQQGSDNYINVNTTNSSENVSIGNATTNPTVSLLGTGTKTIDGTINTDLTAFRTVVTDGSGNLSVNTETGTGSHVKATSPTLVTPTLGVATATSMTLGGGEAFTYGDTSFTLTATGMTTSPTGTAHASRVGRIVTIQLPFITGTSNATSFTLTGVPSDYRPSTFDQEAAITLYQNNGTQESGGYCTVSTGGNITITRRDGALWTNSGTKSVNPANITFIAR